MLLLPCLLWGQNIRIKGKAHVSYRGKIIQLLKQSDYITNLRELQNQDTIQNDGYFELHMQTEHTCPVTLKIDNAVGELFVQPDFVYGITFPEIDKSFDHKNDAELPVNIGVLGNDSTELNALVFDFQEQFNKLFDMKDGRFLNRAEMAKRADSLKRICDRRYKAIKNSYFKSYCEYSVASVNTSISRGENFLIANYIIGKPIQYRHQAYMDFFNACFTGYLNAAASMRKGQSLYHIINTKASYDLLDKFMAEDKFMKNDSLRELVIIKNLWDFYYSSDFEKNAVKLMISDIHVRTKNEEHQKITATMLSFFNQMQTGSPAPNAKARTRTGAVSELSAFKNRWIYLNFFSTRNEGSLREMAKIAAIKKKLGDKLVFVSICVDDSLKSYQEYLKANPKLDWNIWYNDDKTISKTAKQLYFVSGSEAYFLINNLGYLAMSPALSPSNGVEYRLNAIFKPARKNVKTGIR